MKNFIDSVRLSILNQNWFGALFLALCIPDICGRLEFSNMTTKDRYIRWFQENLGSKYNPSFNGQDCYYFRCACLHEASESHDQLSFDRIHFVVPPLNGHKVHRNMLNNVLQLQIDVFCEDICFALEEWLIKVNTNDEINFKLNSFINIYELDSISNFVSFN